MRLIRWSQKGFTIAELMISTAVFGVILLVVSTAIIQFTRVYYKGVTEANTQDIARSIMDRIGQGIEFNGGTVTNTVASPTPGNSYAFCVGGQQYSYTTGYQLSDTPAASQTYHALVVNGVAGCTSSTPAQNVRGSSVSGTELIPPNMRLSKMQVTSIGTNLYKISIRVVFGDDAVLNNPNAATAACKSILNGSQFCAVSDLSTVVTKRVQ